MSRYAAIAQAPAPPTTEGDSEFIGLDMKNDRDKLGPGQYARAENKRCHRKIVEDRPGVQTPVFANVETMTILGSGVFSDPNSEEMQVIAMPGEVRRIKSGSYPETIPTPDGTTLAGAINFAQHFNVLLLHREDGGPTLVWDGIAPAFTRLTKLDPLDTSTVVIPDPPWSVNFGYRAWFPTGADTLGASDELDYTSIDMELHNFRINTGEASSIVAVHGFSQNRLIVGNSRSIDVLTGVIGDLSQASMEILSDEINFAGRRAVGMIGGDLAFLASKPQGVFRITEVIQDQLTTEPVPLSDPIEKLMARINWTVAAGAVMQTLGIYLFLFVPIDSSEVNNAVFVFNTVSKQWVGVDLYDLDALFQINNAQVADHFGQKGLYVINHLANQIHVLEQGLDDELGLSFTVDGDGLPVPIHAIFPSRKVFESRGYTSAEYDPVTRSYFRRIERGDFKRVEIATKTLRPSITVTELTDKATDERPLNATPITKSPTKYDTFGKNDWDPSNANNDFDTPGRQDYSVDFTNDVSIPDSGIDLELRQDTPLKFAIKARGQFMSYRVENTGASGDITGILIESAGTAREPKRGG